MTDQYISVVVQEGEEGAGIQWVYEFSHDFELLRARPGDSYWSHHRLLRLQGHIDHAEETCPERAAIRSLVDS